MNELRQTPSQRAGEILAKFQTASAIRFRIVDSIVEEYYKTLVLGLF
jgi:hypothetical protein